MEIGKDGCASGEMGERGMDNAACSRFESSPMLAPRASLKICEYTGYRYYLNGVRVLRNK